MEKKAAQQQQKHTMRLLSFALPPGLVLNSICRVFYSLALSVGIFIYSIPQAANFFWLVKAYAAPQHLFHKAQLEDLPKGCLSCAFNNMQSACLKLSFHQKLTAGAYAPPLTNQLSTWSPTETVSSAAGGISHVLFSFRKKTPSNEHPLHTLVSCSPSACFQEEHAEL